jgi:hypothetical protein
MADFLERNALRAAQAHAHQAAMFIDQAKRIIPTIQPLPQIQIAQGWVLVATEKAV